LHDALPICHNLNKMLAEAVGYENISFGYQVTSVENTDSGVICHFENGESAEGDVLIGADGIYSTIRDQLAGGVTFRRNDHHAFRWRAIFDIERSEEHTSELQSRFDIVCRL